MLAKYQRTSLQQNGNATILALVAILSIGILGMQFMNQAVTSDQVDFSYISGRTNLRIIRENIVTYLRDSGTIVKTREHITNQDAFSCRINPPGCVQDEEFVVNLIDPDDQPVQLNGFNKNGESCLSYGMGDCIYRFELRWKVDCAPATSPCLAPPIRFIGRFDMHANAKEQKLNLHEFIINPEDLK